MTNILDLNGDSDDLVSVVRTANHFSNVFDDLKRELEVYQNMSENETRNNSSVPIYTDTAWNKTQNMARAKFESLKEMFENDLKPFFEKFE